MRQVGNSAVVLVALLTLVISSTGSHAVTGRISVTVTKAGFLVGAGAGRGVLTYRRRDYPFTVQGLSVGLTAGASINKYIGTASSINELSDFQGTYTVIGAGAAVGAGLSAVQLKNAKGVVMTLQGSKAGLEVSANITKVVITLDELGSSPN